jgi:TPR repeat protein
MNKPKWEAELLEWKYYDMYDELEKVAFMNSLEACDANPTNQDLLVEMAFCYRNGSGVETNIEMGTEYIKEANKIGGPNHYLYFEQDDSKK